MRRLADLADDAIPALLGVLGVAWVHYGERWMIVTMVLLAWLHLRILIARLADAVLVFQEKDEPWVAYGSADDFLSGVDIEIPSPPTRPPTP